MIKQKGTIFFLVSALLASACSTSAYGAYAAPIDYKQTMTVVLRDTDVDDWLPTEARHFQEIVTSAQGGAIAFLVRINNSKSRHLYLADALRPAPSSGSVRPSAGGHQRRQRLQSPLQRRRLKTVLLRNAKADVIYCEVLSVNHFCHTAFSGPIEPFSVDSEGDDAVFQASGGMGRCGGKNRQGLF